MCWAFRLADVGVRAANAEIASPHLGRIVTSGRQAPILIHKGGTFHWLESRYGMMLAGERGTRNLVWNARDDKLETFAPWLRLIRQRFALPIDAYADKNGVEVWRVGEPAFMLGFYDTDAGGGSVAVTEQINDARPPILVSRSDAARWLEASQWEALPLLRKLARVRFQEVDLFENKRLETEARNRIGIRKAA